MKQVLAVDDNPEIRQLLTTMLTGLGYEAVTAASSQEAMSCIQAKAGLFHCILLDIQMPGMNGVDYCRVIRDTDGYSAVPIIMLTAMSERRYLDLAFRNGATDFVQKPFEVNELANRIEIAVRTAAKDSGLNPERQQPENLTARRPALTFDTPLPVTGHRKGVDYASFKRYVWALPFRLATVSVVGLRVEGLDSMYDELSAGEYATVLNHLAEQIENIYDPSAPLFSYAGAGVFLTIRPRLGRTDPNLDEELTLAARTVFRNAKTASVVASGCDRLKFVSGHPVSLPILRRSEREAALKKAKKYALQAQPNHSTEAFDDDLFQDRDSYQAILDSFRSDNDEFWGKRQEGYDRKQPRSS
ncbi:MAG: response regulator [Parvularcula sp.]|jgi:CheY-like chemotaxis protein|nr:response regulator [Parvularcula sp.]